MRCDLAVVGLGIDLPYVRDLADWADPTPLQPARLSPSRWLGPTDAPMPVGAWWDRGDEDGDRVVGAATQALRDLPNGSRVGLVVAGLLSPTSDLVLAALQTTPPSRWPRPVGALTARFGRALPLARPPMWLDAACASGLYALQVAADWLGDGSVDVVVCAGVQGADPTWLSTGFAALRAVSPSGRARPFDVAADGLLVGEGCAAVAVMRGADARRRGVPSRATIAAIATGVDGGRSTPLRPDPDGQLTVLRRAWRGLDPANAAFVEAHATGTPLGDRAEVEAASRFFTGRSAPLPLASSKGASGHLLTAAGIAAVVRTVLHLERRTVPGTPGLATPIEGDAVALRPDSVPFEGPAVAGVSAFGFGGTSAHLVFASCEDAPERPRIPVAIDRCALRWGDAGLTDGRPRLTALALDPLAWRTPPNALASALPQQLALAQLVEALASPESGTAHFAAMEVDPAAAEVLVPGATFDADRVLGTLGNLVANRPMARFDLTGPGASIGGGPLAALSAMDCALRRLGDPDVDDALVTAVDTAGRPGTADAAAAIHLVRGDGPVRVLGVAWGLTRDDAVQALGVPAGRDAASLPLAAGVAAPLVQLAAALAHPGTWIATATDGTWWGAVAVSVDDPVTPSPLPSAPWVLPVRAGRPTPATWSGPWDAATCPLPAPGWSSAPVRMVGEPGTDEDLVWVGRPLPATPEIPVDDPLPANALTSDTVLLAEAFVAHRRAVTAAHSQFLALRASAAEALGRPDATRAPSTSAPPTTSAPTPRAPTPPPVVAAARPTTAAPPVPLTLDRAGLLAHASASLSEALGPAFADLDVIRPRVRMPAPPLLLVDRVVAFRGTCRSPGPSGIVTEYDVPDDPTWNDGRPPPCVVVESGQADLLLVSWLGIDARLRGERRYRLLDCTLTFHAARPDAGATLRHDISIDRFATLGDTTLFYFRYDVHHGDNVVLTMREGCAGFFTPAELATPRGVDAAPLARPTRALPPLVHGARTSLDEAALDALSEGRSADGLGPTFAGADGARLRLPHPRWRLVHRAPAVHVVGPPHGLGRVVLEQDLHDDDWFNPVHFVDDPCMPGTLMLEACTTAVRLWLLAFGAAVVCPNATFEPLVDVPITLRCRGQVAPGHRLLTIEASITEAGTTPAPWAMADVVLSVDGVAVMRATGVGLRVVASPAPVGGSRAELLAFATGSTMDAFGPDWEDVNGPGRLARMAGPPIAMIDAIEVVSGAPRVVTSPAHVLATSLVPEDHPGLAATGRLPLGVLLEVALQPCGWLTAWQGAGIEPGAKRCFRNLDGTAELLRTPRPGRFRVAATQRSSAAHGGVRVHDFATTVSDADGPVFRATTRFGYFAPEAFEVSRGLSGDDVASLLALAATTTEGEPWPADLPRSDWRFVTHLTGRGDAHLAGRADVDPAAWPFAAHFLHDPVLPGSLGLDGLAAMAHLAWREAKGTEGDWLPGPLSWTYRGQVSPRVRRVDSAVRWTWEGDVLVADGLVIADGLPIYHLRGLRIGPQGTVARARPEPAAIWLRQTASDAEFDGILHLPANLSWLDDHRPTRARPAVPLAFAVGIATEVAGRFGSVAGVTLARANRWLDVPGDALDLAIRAVRRDDTVRVVLAGGAVEVDVLLGVPTAIGSAARPDVEQVIDPAAFFASGAVFHGPSLAKVTSWAAGRQGALLEIPAWGPWGAVDPGVLDGATHAMWSATPERWGADAGLAYPVALRDLRLAGPPPIGPSTVVVTLREAAGKRLGFDVVASGPDGPWASWSWDERVVAAGPVLSLPEGVRRAFLWDADPAGVTVGRAEGDGSWSVGPGDLLEPMPGSFASWWQAVGEPPADGARIAAKECIRARLRARGVDVHPSRIELVATPKGFAVGRTGLPADISLPAIGPRVGHIESTTTAGRFGARWVDAPT